MDGAEEGDKDKRIEAGIKAYYAYLQVFHHDKFRESSSDLEKEIRKLISGIERDDEAENYSEKNRKLLALVLGISYRCLGQFKIEYGEDKYNSWVETIVRKYMGSTADFGNNGGISVHDSDVYIECFSEEDDNFGLWSNYADNEKGCVIGFAESFFDFADSNAYSIYL